MAMQPGRSACRAALAIGATAALLSACTSSSHGPAPAPGPTRAPGLGGFINSTRCNSYLASIDANTRALAAAEALQSEAEMAQLRAQIAADRTAAAAIAGCHPPT